MARGPKGEKRPDDPAAAAVLSVRIALGEASDELDAPAAVKDPAAVALGRRGGVLGGVSRAKSLSKEERSAIARRAAKARWGRNAG